VIREGSFEKAAADLGITASAVSQRVRGYEDRLGAVLVVREQPCRPTDLGQKLCSHFDRVRLMETDLSLDLAIEGLTRPSQIPLKVAVNADSLSTWFPHAAAEFVNKAGMMLDLTLADEAQTAEKLRSGEVFAAVTAGPEPVIGCKTTPLGALRYVACATPAFIKTYFAEGVSPSTLARAPQLRFDKWDTMQARWIQQTFGAEVHAPTHWVPSAQGFLDMCRMGLGWSMQPLNLVAPHLGTGQIAELQPGTPLDVDLYWTVAHLHAGALRVLTEAVRKATRHSLQLPG
jgi:LysR family transcriptional regulator (chromosome initiation inhibitor)